jgi:hypothetical protein
MRTHEPPSFLSQGPNENIDLNKQKNDREELIEYSNKTNSSSCQNLDASNSADGYSSDSCLDDETVKLLSKGTFFIK